MPNVERRRPPVSRKPGTALHKALRDGARRRTVALVGSASLVLCAGQVFGFLGTLPAGGTSPADAALGITIASYSGDAVTTTPSEAVQAGSDVTYQVALANAGPNALTNVSVTVTLPSSFTLDTTTVTTSAGTASVAGDVVTWSVPSVAASSSATLSYTETTDAPPAFDSATTSASATSAQSTSATTATAGVDVVPAADLAVSVTDGVGTVAPADAAIDTITVTDNGPSDADNVTVADVFNDDVASLGADGSSPDAIFNDLGDGQFQWSDVDVSSGSSVTFDLEVAVPSPLAAGSAFVNQASVATAPGEIDTNPVAYATDSDIVSGTGSGANLDLAVASYGGDSVGTTTSESALAGTDVTYQVTVANTSADTQTNVVVPVSLPPAFTLDASAVASDGTTSLGAGVLTWSIPSLAAGASDDLTYTETTDAPVAMESDTTTASATSDQTSSASTASASVNVIPASDLTIQVSDSMGSVYAGASDTYTITLTNNGPSTVTNAMVSDTFSDGFIAFVAVSSLSGTSFANLGGNAFEWSGITLPSGASATFDLMGALPTTLVTGGAYTDLASGSVPPGQADTDDTSTATDSDTVIAASQAIAFSPPSLGVVGQSATLSASGGGSGNPVTFSVDPGSEPGVCDVSGIDGTTLEYVAPGSCIVDANQAGNASYAAAATVSVSIPVDQMPAFTADAPPTTDTGGDDYAYTFDVSGVPAPTFALAPGAPSWLTMDSTSGTLSGTPPAGTTSFSYSVIATNGVGSASAGPFSVAVAPPPPPPHPQDADISVTLGCPTAVAVRSVGNCTLIVHNAGPATARFVTVELALPFRFARVGATRGGFWFGNVGTWFVGALDPGSAATFSVSFVAFFPGRDTVVGLGLAETRDSDYANNLATAPVTVTG